MLTTFVLIAKFASAILSVVVVGYHFLVEHFRSVGYLCYAALVLATLLAANGVVDRVLVVLVLLASLIVGMRVAHYNALSASA